MIRSSVVILASSVRTPRNLSWEQTRLTKKVGGFRSSVSPSAAASHFHGWDHCYPSNPRARQYQTESVSVNKDTRK